MVHGEPVEKIDDRYILITDSATDRCFATDLGQVCKAYNVQRSSGARYVTMLRFHDWCTLLPDDVLASLHQDIAALHSLTEHWGADRKVQGVLEYKTPPAGVLLPGAGNDSGEGNGGEGNGGAERPTYYIALTWIAPCAPANQLFEQGVKTPEQAVAFVAALGEQLDRIYTATTCLHPAIKLEALALEPGANGQAHLVLGDLGFDNFLDLPERSENDQDNDVRLLVALLVQLLDGAARRWAGALPPAFSLAELRKEAGELRAAWPWQPPSAAAPEDLWAVLGDTSIREFRTLAARLRQCSSPALAGAPLAPFRPAQGGTAAVQPPIPPPGPGSDPGNGAANGAGYAVAATTVWQDQLLIRIIEGVNEFVLTQPLLEDGIVLIGEQGLACKSYPAQLDESERNARFGEFAGKLRQRRVYVQHHRNKTTGTAYYTITDFDPPTSAARTLLNGQPLSPLFAALITNRSVIELDNGIRVNLDSQIPASAAGWIAAVDQGVVVLALDAPGQRLAVEPHQESVSLPLTIHNPTQRVEGLSIFVDGAPADWPLCAPITIRLFEKETVQKHYVLALPQERLAREYPLRVRLISDNIGAQVAVLALRLDILRLFEYGSELQPDKVRAGEYGELHLHNASNFGRQFVITWRDRADELVFDPPQTLVSLPAYSSGVIGYRARLAQKARRLFGSEKQHEMLVTVTPEHKTHGAPRTLQGQVLSRAALSPLELAGALLLLAVFFAFITLWFPPLFTSHTVEVDGAPVAAPVAGRPLALVWQSQNACLHSLILNGETQATPGGELLNDANRWPLDDPKAGDVLTVQLRGCTFVRTQDWTVTVAPAPAATPPPPVAPTLANTQSLTLRTQNVQLAGPGAGGATGGPTGDAPAGGQQILLAGQTGELCVAWNIEEAYAKDVYGLQLVTQPHVEAIEQAAQIEQPSGEKCFPIATTFTDVITDSARPNIYYIGVGAVEKATGNLLVRSQEAEVVQVFKPACRVTATEPVWVREGPGEEYAERSMLIPEEVVFPVGSPLQLRQPAPQGNWWAPITVANDPRPGWVALRYLYCPVPINVLAPNGQVPPTPTATPSPSPTATPLPTATPTPPPAPVFEVAPKIIEVGECAMLTWSIQNVEAVYLNGEGVAGESEREVCPTRDGRFAYTWTIINKDGSTVEKSVTLIVNGN